MRRQRRQAHKRRLAARRQAGTQPIHELQDPHEAGRHSGRRHRRTADRQRGFVGRRRLLLPGEQHVRQGPAAGAAAGPGATTESAAPRGADGQQQVRQHQVAAEGGGSERGVQVYRGVQGGEQ